MRVAGCSRSSSETRSPQPATLFLLLLFFAATAFARVDRIDVATRADLLGGRDFGLAGPYEKLIGIVHFLLDPKDLHNGPIVDLDKAPRNAEGLVAFSADFYVLKPKNFARGNGTILLEISNRGGKALLPRYNGAKGSSDPTTAEETGDEWLMREGYSLVWIGWQFDVRPDPKLLHLYAPVVPNLVGRVRSDWVVPETKFEHPVSHVIGGNIGGVGYPVLDPKDPKNTLTMRDAQNGPRTTIDHSRWRFVNNFTIHYDDGFVPGKIYEAIYTAKDPAVVGTGFAAVRDFISYCKYDRHSPLPAARAYGFGISQSGRYLRHFLYDGFNRDEHDRQVFDALIVHVAGAGRGGFNQRWAQPSRDAQPLTPAFYPVDVFPFTDLPEVDPFSGVRAGLEDRAALDHVQPKIFYTNTSYEYWSRGESLSHTTPDGKADAPLPDNVRIYLLTGLQHSSGPFPPAKSSDLDTLGQQPESPLPVIWFHRALLADMDAWVKDGVAPPASRYPRIDNHTLVPVSALALKSIGGVAVPTFAYAPYAIDPSKGEPPRVLGQYPVLVPQVGRDGNELAGVRLPELVVPVAAYTGWNLRDPKIGFPTVRTSFIGSYIQFSHETLAKLYRERDEYLGRFAEAAMTLVRERFLLPPDLGPLLARGAREYAEATK